MKYTIQMARRIIYLTLLLIALKNVNGQQAFIDSLKKEFNSVQNDTSKLIYLRTIARIYAEINPDSAYRYAERSLEYSRKLHYKVDEGGALREMGYALLNRSNYPRSLQLLLSAIQILEDPGIEKNVIVGKYRGDDELLYRTAAPHLQRLNELAFTHQMMGILYANSNNYEKARYHHLLAREKAGQSGNMPLNSIINLTMNRVYLNLKKTDSALISIQLSYKQAMEAGYKKYLGSVLLNMGRTYAAMGNKTLANEYYRKSLVASEEQGYYRGLVAGNLILADNFFETGKNDSAFLYIKNALSVAQNLDAPELLQRSYTRLTRHYRTIGNNDSAVKYQALIIKINDSLFTAKQAQEFQNIDFDAQQKAKDILETQKEYQNRMQKYLLVGGLAALFLLASFLLRNNQNRKKTNAILQKKNTEIEMAMANLKATQSQLIQSEKMASLGELTAGIAHEIQNPLNFVNNFSELNMELLQDMKMEIDNGNLNEVKSIASNVMENQDKINQHGKRADAIVKGMLQHSRTNSGEKQLTDINTLTDEYFRLAYHGFRAKFKTFNATLKTDFDPSIGNINIIPQDIGRVLLNLINNAFYAVNEKSKKNMDGFVPVVEISTNKADNKMEIKVKDNGDGISEKIKAKIFQPFFTTKPAGQGTGLGLSLSYDIIKAHGGTISLDSVEGEGSVFTITLPTIT